MRFERKFFIPNIRRNVVEAMIYRHPGCFSEIYSERYVNNIYFDTSDFHNYCDNIHGNMFRTKFRIRWYGDMITAIERPVLEVKIKKGSVGMKKAYQLNPFRLTKPFGGDVLKNLINASEVDKQTKINMQVQIPVLLNRYRRKYYVSSDKRYRITIDDTQSFYRIGVYNNMLISKFIDNSSTIIELKYDKKYDVNARHITNGFPFRITKSSKYVRGIQLFYA
ncbi:MAG: VTC domain-containing protein [Cytophagales bacterium]|nr:VTC domain-containing protein [Cytophagales bacterium]